MSKNLIDTNLILRFLLNDIPEQANRVEQLLKNRSNTNILLDTIIAEIIWVLSSYYNVNKKQIIENVTALMQVSTIECNSLLISEALSLWQTYNISYIDAYLAAVTEFGHLTLYTYDQKLHTIKSITTKKP